MIKIEKTIIFEVWDSLGHIYKNALSETQFIDFVNNNMNVVYMIRGVE